MPSISTIICTEFPWHACLRLIARVPILTGLQYYHDQIGLPPDARIL